MSLKALIATLILGSSSVALAAPQVRDHRTPTPVVVTPKRPVVAGQFEAHFDRNDIRPVRPIYTPPAPALTWVTLANDASINGRTQINVAKGTRAFTKLELRADGNGRASIDKVTIVYGNGQRQVVNLDARLTKKSPSVLIDLAGEQRFITKIVLSGKTNGRNAKIDILAL